MGRFDLETDAALAQLNFEELAKTPGGEFAEIIGDLLTLIGGGGPLTIAGKASNLALKIRRLAGASYTSNLIYVITAVRNDLADSTQNTQSNASGSSRFPRIRNSRKQLQHSHCAP